MRTLSEAIRDALWQLISELKDRGKIPPSCHEIAEIAEEVADKLESRRPGGQKKLAEETDDVLTYFNDQLLKSPSKREATKRTAEYYRVSPRKIDYLRKEAREVSSLEEWRSFDEEEITIG